jgi:hypothetical protein
MQAFEDPSQSQEILDFYHRCCRVGRIFSELSSGVLFLASLVQK